MISIVLIFPQQSSLNSRVGIIHNPKATSEPASKLYIARAVEAVLQSKDHVTPAIQEFIEKLLDSKNDFEKLDGDLDAVMTLIKSVKV